MQTRALFVALAVVAAGCAAEQQPDGRVSIEPGSAVQEREREAAVSAGPEQEAPGAEASPESEPASEPPEGAGTCETYFLCAGECAPYDVTCYDACAAETSGDGIDQAVALTSCYDEAGCYESASYGEYYGCIAASCSGETSACYGEAWSTGDGTCQGYSECLAACETDDEACTEACWLDSAPGEAGLYWDLSLCVWEAGCDAAESSTEYMECADAACGDLMSACIAGWPGGELSCGEYSDCAAGCAAADAACWEGCSAQMSPSGLGLLQDVYACAEEASCASETTSAGWFACMDAHCGDLALSCYEGDWPGGDGSCQDYVGCLYGCPYGADAEDCWAACGEDASPTAVGEWYDLSLCLDAAGCYAAPTQPAFDACAEESCAAGMATCWPAAEE
jgi:hypothetical protein